MDSSLNNETESPKVGPQFSEKVQRLIMESGFDQEKKIKKPQSLISINGSLIASLGNVSVISGENKAGKSSVIGAIIAGAISDEPMDTIGITVAKNTNQKAIIHIDTEQPKYDHYWMNSSILKRAKLEKKPQGYYSFAWIGKKPSELVKNMELTCKDMNMMHGGIHMVLIDGIGDFVSSVNLDEASNEVTRVIMNIARKYNTHVVVVLHMNPMKVKADAKGPRGHLGSELMRKSESVLLVTRNRDVSTLKAKHLRHARGFGEIKFEYNDEHQMHMLQTVKTPEDIAKEKKAKQNERKAKNWKRGGRVLSL